jgi:hypothetical protein
VATKKNNVLQLIKDNHGIFFDQLSNLLSEEKGKHDLSLILNSLIGEGMITFIWNKYYPNVRSIGVIPKGQTKTTEIIDLLNEIQLDEIAKVIPSKLDDPLYYDGYLITKESSNIFEKTNHFEFDFEHFDYYLLSSFDNSNDINHK